MADGTAPPFVGLRFKSLEPATRRRGLRTLDLFLGGIASAGELPPGFAVTLPKVTQVEQAEAFVGVCAALEQAHGLDPGRLKFEIQIETPQTVGTCIRASWSPATPPRTRSIARACRKRRDVCGPTSTTSAAISTTPTAISTTPTAM